MPNDPRHSKHFCFAHKQGSLASVLQNEGLVAVTSRKNVHSLIPQISFLRSKNHSESNIDSPML
jgi:hypothetical protein